MTTQMLVIIDPQNDFTHADGNYARRHQRITQIASAKSNISRLLNQFDQSKKIIVRSDYKADQFGAGLSMCIPGTFGHEIDADLQADSTWTILTKTDHSCFSSAAFKGLLQKSKTETLLLCGFLAEYCVKQTAADALDLGLRVFLIADCIATGDEVQHRKDQVFDELMKKGAAVIQSRDLYSGPDQI